MSRRQIKELGQALIAYSMDIPVQWFNRATNRWQDCDPSAVMGMMREPDMRLRPKP